MQKKILFVSHEASRSGAPKVLLYFLNWLASHTDFEIFILLKKDGELLSEFEALGKVFLWPTEGINRYFLLKGLARLGIPLEILAIKHLNRRLRGYHFNLIYVNSISCSDIVVKLKEGGLRAPVLCHVHELKTVISLVSQHLEEAKRHIKRYVAVSEATRYNLIENEKIAAEEIELVYEFLPVDDAQRTRCPASLMKRNLGLPENSFVIGGAGLAHWRKGHDLLIGVARIIEALKPKNNYYYLWVGHISDLERQITEEDLRKSGLSDKINFVGSSSYPYDYLQVYDIFVLPSREDPFPLVCLEAIALGKPIVCFEGAGGIPELTAQGCGVAVPYLDTLAMAHKIIELSEHPDWLAQLGKHAKIISQDYDTERACEQLLTIVNNIVAP